MTTCSACGADTSTTVRRGALMAQENPPAAFWQGIRVRMDPADAAMLFLLIRREFVSIDAFQERAPLGGGNTNLAAVIEDTPGTSRRWRTRGHHM